MNHDFRKELRKNIIRCYTYDIRMIIDIMVIFFGTNKNNKCRYKGFIPYMILNEIDYFIDG